MWMNRAPFHSYCIASAAASVRIATRAFVTIITSKKTN
jgi:hypothetical protein